MSRPEPPAVLWFNGKLVPWREATVHVWSEVAARGANVFEGIRCYRQTDGSFCLVSLEQHLDRLSDSARLMSISSPYPRSELMAGIFELVREIAGDQHIYVRPTTYVEYGRYGDCDDDAVYGAYIVAFPVPRSKAAHDGARCCVSSWRRTSDLSMSPLIKAGAAYQAFRLPGIEARRRGCDEAILLNDRGHVAEATGAAIFTVRRGEVSTPPLSAGILDSITRRHAMTLVEDSLGQRVRERDIPRTELYLSDEVFLAGTLSELTPVLLIDSRPVGDGQIGPVTRAVRDRYFAICEGRLPDRWDWLTPVPGPASAASEVRS